MQTKRKMIQVDQNDRLMYINGLWSIEWQRIVNEWKLNWDFLANRKTVELNLRHVGRPIQRQMGYKSIRIVYHGTRLKRHSWVCFSSFLLFAWTIFFFHFLEKKNFSSFLVGVWLFRWVSRAGPMRIGPQRMAEALKRTGVPSSWTTNFLLGNISENARPPTSSPSLTITKGGGIHA